MMSLEKLSLELLEYKIEDIQAGRKIKGGLDSAWELYDFLLKGEYMLEQAENYKLAKFGEILKAQIAMLAKARSTSVDLKSSFEKLMTESFPDIQRSQFGNKAVADFDELLSTDTTVASPSFDHAIDWFDEALATKELSSNPEFVAEQKILQNLALKLWWHDLDNQLQNLAIFYKLEPDLLTARLLYALLRNFEHYSNQKGFADDIELEKFRVVFPITKKDDPLAILDDIETIKDLNKRLIKMIFNLSSESGDFIKLKLDSVKSIDYFEKMALKIADNPFSESSPSQRQSKLSSADVKIAMQDLINSKSVLEDERKRQLKVLDKRYRELRDFELAKNDRENREKIYFSKVIRNYFSKLRTILFKSYGGNLDSPRLAGGVLFAKNPVLDANAIPVGAKAITVRIKGPMRFKLAGLELALMGSGNHMMIYLDGDEYPLEKQSRLSAKNKTLIALLEDSYLHLRLEDESFTLVEQLARGLVLLKILSSEYSKELLQVLKIISLSANDSPYTIVEAALGRFKQFSSKAPSTRPVVEGLIRAAVKSQNIELPENVILSIVQTILNALTSESKDFDIVLESANHSEIKLIEMSSDALNIYIDNQDLGLRRYRSSIRPEYIAVLSANKFLGSFSTMMIKPFSTGSIMLIKHANEIAILYFNHVVVDL